MARPYFLTAVVVALLGAGCGDVNSTLEKISRAQSLSGDLLTHFTKVSDAANRAVMANTDELSVAFAAEAEEARQAVQNDISALQPLLDELNYPDERRRLQEFVVRFSEYNALDKEILELAVQHTNLKAQRLAFSDAQSAADELQAALGRIRPGAGQDPWRAKAVAAEAGSAVRQIQVLQAVHIADPDDRAMTGFESRMAEQQAVARTNLGVLATLTAPASGAALASATGAFERFLSVNAEIVALSRRNTNVRSLAMSLDRKRQLVTPCEDAARALRDALSKRGYSAGR